MHVAKPRWMADSHQHPVDVVDLHLLYAGRDVLTLSGGPPLPPGVQECLHRRLHHLQ